MERCSYYSKMAGQPSLHCLVAVACELNENVFDQPSVYLLRHSYKKMLQVHNSCN